MKSITITDEQFMAAIEKANKRFGEVGADREDRNPMAEFMMQMQNSIFGCILKDVLFNNEEDK